MTKRILSVIMVLIVFFGGYAALPKKYNPLPTTDVSAATFASGAYKVLAPFTAEKIDWQQELSSGYTITSYVTKRYKCGDVISVKSNGYTYDGYYVGGVLSNKAYIKKIY